MAAAEGGVHEFARPDVVAHCFPEIIAAVGLHPLDSGLATAPAFHHALQGFEAVEVIAIDAAVADAECFADLGAEGHFDGRGPPGDGEAGAGLEGELQLTGGVVHFLGPVPVPREVLVVEDGHGAATLAEDVHDLGEELIAWVLGLSLFVLGVIAMLADEDDAVDGEFAGT